MSLIMEEIILACLVLTGSVQISDHVTLVCDRPTERVEEVHGTDLEDGQADVEERRPTRPPEFVPPPYPNGCPPEMLCQPDR